MRLIDYKGAEGFSLVPTAPCAFTWHSSHVAPGNWCEAVLYAHTAHGRTRLSGVVALRGGKRLRFELFCGGLALAPILAQSHALRDDVWARATRLAYGVF
jgi:hypothetical protein